MRVLHTSDWHLGRSFHGEGLIQAQADFIDHLVDTVRSERVDVVAVAGDLYDRALPSIDAVRLFSEALARIRDTGARAVLISGNHDSMARLAYATDLIAASGVHLYSSLEAVGRPVVIDDAHGPVACYGIPYLEPEVVRHPWGLARRSHTDAIEHAMSRVHADLATRPRGTRSIVLSHVFVSGGEASDSERDISVGGVAHVPAQAFAGVDYAALGHLHGRQSMTDTVRYCGSPLAYSFSEEHHRKGCWLVDIDGRGLAAAEFVPAPVPRPIARLRGRIEELLTGAEWEPYTEHWLQITLTDPLRPGFAMDRLRERFPHTLSLDFAPEEDRDRTSATWSQRVADRTDLDLALDFVDWARGVSATPDERALLQRAFEEARIREVAR